MHKGFLITFEGIEGCGKSTQINHLARFLKKEGYTVEKTKEPGGTKVGEAIRRVLLDAKNRDMAPYAELLLYQASRVQLISKVIIPALREGKVVLCDRFIDSTVAYQGHGRGLDLDKIDELNRLATTGVRPDFTIILDIPAEEGLGRIEKRKKSMAEKRDRIEAEELSFHKRVREGYLRLAEKEPDRIIVVSANKSVEEIQKEIRKIVIDRMRVGDVF